MRIVITGSPGTGKSVIARKLSSTMDLNLIDIAAIARSSGLVGKNHEVDLGKLSRKLFFLKKEDDFIAEGHLACEIKLPCDLILALRCRPDILARRLKKRKYGKEKILENTLAEALDYCSQRVEKVYGRKPLELETSGRTIIDSLALLKKAIKNKKKTIDSVDYSDYLRRIALK